jgi:hypothetical protein
MKYLIFLLCFCFLNINTSFADVLKNCKLNNFNLHQKIELMLVGDSITVGQSQYILSTEAVDNSYIATRGSYYSYRNYHAGISGQKTEEVILRISDNISHFSEDGRRVVIIHIGTNDITADVDNETTVSNINTIINSIVDY